MTSQQEQRKENGGAGAFYITTPIYYVNDVPHLGHAYTTVIADVMTRYQQLFGKEAFFLTGTDEHGQKVAEAAKTRGISPQAHVDLMVHNFQQCWEKLEIVPNFFIRTTFDLHKKTVSDCLMKLYENGEIYSKDYEGWYSVSEEIFYTDKDIVDGKSPEGKKVERVKEKNYFFRMSKYQERLIEHIQSNPDFLYPESRRNEVLGFLRRPLEDLCISRPKSRMAWGIDLPFDTDYVTYVWFDALLNYISGIGYGQAGKEAHFGTFWPEARHLIGKDILITHSIYWPTMLMALGLPLPKQIVAHGWWVIESGKKMSKSEGPVVAPLQVVDIVGVEAFRYFLVRAMHLGNDAVFSLPDVVARTNADLANNIGNLASRSLALVERHFEGKVPAGKEARHPETKQLAAELPQLSADLQRCVAEMAPDLAAEAVVSFVTKSNQYFTQMAPWDAVKHDREKAAEALYAALESLRAAAIALRPVMPHKMDLLLSQIGWRGELSLRAAGTWGLLEEGAQTARGESLFPKVNLE